jgi:hypothetical protein
MLKHSTFWYEIMHFTILGNLPIIGDIPLQPFNFSFMKPTNAPLIYTNILILLLHVSLLCHPWGASRQDLKVTKTYQIKE